MVGLKLVAIFIFALIIDSLLLSAFFGLRESFLSLLVFVAPILYLGSTKQLAAYGLAFAFISESLRGLSLGDLVIPFLLTAAVVSLLQRFLDIKYTYDTRFGLGKSILIVLALAAFIYIFAFFFKQNGLNINYFNSAIWLTTLLEALILILIFNIMFNKKSDYL